MTILYESDDGTVITEDELQMMTTSEKLDLVHKLNIELRQQVDSTPSNT